MMEINFQDDKLLPLWEKVQQEERLTREEGQILWGTEDLLSLGKMAAAVQQRMHGDAVYFALSQKLAPAGICLYGQGETSAERLDCLLELRAAQDEAGGFMAFAPLAFPMDGAVLNSLPELALADKIKIIAVARLMLDNVPHIKVPLAMGEIAAAQALGCGADDLEGTPDGETAALEDGAPGPAALAQERLVKTIQQAGKIPVERDAYYRPLHVLAENVVGKITYLNSVPFYNYFEKGAFQLLPAAPRYLGMLSARGGIIAAPFSLMDYLAQEEDLELMDYCIASREKVLSILLFSRYPWSELQGKNIGIIDDTATSVHLLRVLLEKKYQVAATLTRMKGENSNYQDFAAVLLIGDEALRRGKTGLPGFARVFDLAAEWYAWQKMPFVFAVWAVRKSLSPAVKRDLKEALRKALAREEREPAPGNARHGRRIGLTPLETAAYLEGINFHLGEAERAALEVFRELAIP